MKKRVTSILIVLLFAFALTSCGSSGTNTTPSASAGTASPSASVAPSGNAVSIESFSFKPAELSVAVGTTVVWTHNESTVHNIKSADFSSPSMKKGETFSFTFDKAGTYDYSCGIHPSMTGRIIVK